MLYTKFQGHRSIDSREEDFYSFLPYMGVRPYWSCDLESLNKFSFPPPRRLFMKFGYNWFSGFGGDVSNSQNMMRVLGQKTNNDHDFFHSQIFIYTFR